MANEKVGKKIIFILLITMLLLVIACGNDARSDTGAESNMDAKSDTDAKSDKDTKSNTDDKSDKDTETNMEDKKQENEKELDFSFIKEEMEDEKTKGEKKDMENRTVKNGDKIAVHYRGTLENGEQFDSSYDRGQTLDFTVGAGQMIAGFDKGVVGMKIGEKKTVTIPPQEAYGLRDEKNQVTIPLETFGQLPKNVKVGDFIPVQSASGGFVEAKIKALTDTEVTLDLNHKLAGETLIFEIELVNIK